MKPGVDAHVDASLELFNAAFEQDAMGMALRAVDPQHSLWLRVNQKLCDMLGYTREEMLKLTSLEVSVPEDRPTVIEFNERLRNGELESYSREKQYVRKDGTTIWTNICLTAVHDADGKPTQIIAIIQDISERKAAEDALKISEETLRAALESIPQGVALYDADDKLVVVNENYFKARPDLRKFAKPGITFKELLYKSDESGERNAAQGESKLSVEERLAWHKNPHGPMYVKQPDGRTYQVDEVKTSAGGIAFIRTDITELKKSESLLRTAVESIPDGFALFDSDDRLTLVNENFFKGRSELKEKLKLGMTFEEMVILREEFRLSEKELGTGLLEKEERIRRHKSPQGPYQSPRSDGRTLQINEVKTPDGGIALIRTEVSDLKREEDSLAQSEELYRTLVDSSPNAIYFHKDEKIIYANPAMATLLGVKSADELVGRSALQHVPKDIQETIKNRWHSMLETGKTAGMLDQKFIKDDGSVIDVAAQGTRISYMSEPAIMIIALDITERKLAEEARDRLSQAVEALPVGVALFDSDDRLSFFNACYREQMAVMADILRPGVSYEEMIRTIVARRPVKNARGREEEFIQERVKHHRNPTKPVDIMRDHRWLQANETRLDDGSIFTIVSDITELKNTQVALQNANDELEERIAERTAHLESEINERKRTELELRTSEERFRTLLDTANYGILVHRNRVPLYANNALAKLYGYNSPDEVLALDSTKDLTHPDFEEGTHEARLGNERVIADKETKGVKRNGATFWEDRRSFVIDWDGEKAICSIRSDIDERKRTQNALLEAKLEAETLSQVKTDFLANMSHELRTTLNAVIGFSEAILGQTFGPIANEKQEEYIQDINNSGIHLLKLINDILDVTAIEEGKLDLQDNQVEIRPLVKEISKMVQPRAKAGNVTVSSEVGENLFAIRGDERRFKQILLNLLTNGIKFTPGGGEVTLKCHLDGQGQMIFVVTDNGIGMNEAGIQIALEPFGQVDEALDRKYEGTGLGLPLTKQLVESHEGHLEVYSELGTGTTVTVAFPKERVIH